MLQYNIAIAGIADTFFSIAIGIAIFFYVISLLVSRDTLFNIAYHAIAIILAILALGINYI